MNTESLTERLQASGLLYDFRLIAPPEEHSGPPSCSNCGLEASHPKARIGSSGLCELCRDYRSNRERIHLYYRTMEELCDLFRKTRKENPGSTYDCLLLFSGGKDSTYALYQLVSMQVRVMTFTFDNGFISHRALENIHNITSTLGIPHVTGSLENMPEVFRESLARHSNVCNGCFKGLLDRSLRTAGEYSIPAIITGLSRGQIADERLTWFHERNVYEPEEIERQLQFGRHVYHHLEDYSGLRLQGLAATSLLERVKVIDFYRYCDVTRDEIQLFLERKAAVWRKPEDCGFCSSNCLVNDTGIYVHQLERGYHSYSSSTAWEVRLGHRSLAAAREELATLPKPSQVLKILNHIGYSPQNLLRPKEGSWTLQFVPAPGKDRAWVRERLGELVGTLEAHMELVMMDALPSVRSASIKISDARPPIGLENGTLPLFAAQTRQLAGGSIDAGLLWQRIEVEAGELLHTAALRKAFLRLMLRHDTLRLAFDEDRSGCIQRFLPPAVGVDIRVFRVSAINSGVLEFAGRQAVLPRSGTGPHWRVVCLQPENAARTYLVIGVHEWIADLESWSMLLEDLESIYRQLHSGTPGLMPAKPGSLASFTDVHPMASVASLGKVGGRYCTVARVAPAADQDTQTVFQALGNALLQTAQLLHATVDYSISARNGNLSPELARTAGFFRTVQAFLIDRDGKRDQHGASKQSRIRLSWDGTIQKIEGRLFHLKARRPPPSAAAYTIDVRAQCIDGLLETFWIFDPSAYSVEFIEQAAGRAMQLLRLAR